MVPQRACEWCVESFRGGDVAENGPKAPLKKFLCQAGRCLRVFLVWFLLFSGWFCSLRRMAAQQLFVVHPSEFYFWRCSCVTGCGSLHPVTRRAVILVFFGLVGVELAHKTPNFSSFSGGRSVGLLVWVLNWNRSPHARKIPLFFCEKRWFSPNLVYSQGQNIGYMGHFFRSFRLFLSDRILFGIF